MPQRTRRTRSRARSIDRTAGTEAAARVGLSARGIVYLLVGVLAVLLARGARDTHVDQTGALTELLSQSYGSVLVAALALGFLAYALWRLSEAAFGVTGERGSTTARLKSLARGILYLALTVTAVAALRGSAQTQAGRQESLTARALSHTGGRLLVVLVGLIVVGAGLAMIVEGRKLVFMKYFRAVPANVRPTVVTLGRVGHIGRGAVLALVGALIVSAGWTLDPGRSGGVDGAFRTLLAEPFGAVLAVAAGLALMAFGVFGLAEARYRRV